ncbi:unnamed protein product [Linum trigynum]|uniref:CCHC-type domain-containing protein n=1 Tax=Linum trigynum TaxID=586398 RepID=A0AAV2GUD7_9ROSI
MVVWIQFPVFPVHFYHKEILFTLGNMVGRAIKLDFHTQHQQRAKFARMAVELDLSKPLVTRIRLDGKWQYIEYENLPDCCFECGKIGHTTMSCPTLAAKPQLLTGEANSGSSEAWPEKASEEKQGFGPWMQVTRKSRRGNRNGEKGNLNAIIGDTPGIGKAGRGKNCSQELESHNGLKGGQKEVPNQRAEMARVKTNEKGKSVGNGNRKGKEKLGKEVVEQANGGKGVLGPIPSSKAIPSLGATVTRAKEVGADSFVTGPKSVGAPSSSKSSNKVTLPPPTPVHVVSGQIPRQFKLLLSRPSIIRGPRTPKMRPRRRRHA